MGTPRFVIPVLEAVERLAPAINGKVSAVYTAPDRAAGRGRHVAASPVKEYATKRGYQVFDPRRLRNAEEVARFSALGADLVVLAAYGLILPSDFLFRPRYGAINVHPSLLPKHRGAAPIPAAILAGDAVTGTTIIKMDEGLDTGDVLWREEVSLDGTERTPELTERLFQLGGELLKACLPPYIRGELTPRPQASMGVEPTLVKRFTKEDGLLDWRRPAVELERMVRAFDPWPGTTAVWRGERLDVLSATVGPHVTAAPGTVVRLGKAIAIATEQGSFVLERVRPAGKTPMDVQAFVAGRPEFVGAVLPS